MTNSVDIQDIQRVSQRCTYIAVFIPFLKMFVKQFTVWHPVYILLSYQINNIHPNLQKISITYFKRYIVQYSTLYIILHYTSAELNQMKLISGGRPNMSICWNRKIVANPKQKHKKRHRAVFPLHLCLVCFVHLGSLFKDLKIEKT